MLHVVQRAREGSSVRGERLLRTLECLLRMLRGVLRMLEGFILSLRGFICSLHVFAAYAADVCCALGGGLNSRFLAGKAWGAGNAVRQ